MASKQNLYLIIIYSLRNNAVVFFFNNKKFTEKFQVQFKESFFFSFLHRLLS